MEQFDGTPIKESWHDFSVQCGALSGREYVVVRPEEGTENGKWALKTEYFGAFPSLEVALLHRGFHVAHIKTKTRWCLDEDTEAQAEFADFLHQKLGLSETCVPIGMSCGGMQGIYLAGKHPEKVACMYLDAPILNFLSCPFGLGESHLVKRITDEFIRDRGLTLRDMITARNHPQDYIPALIKHKIPIALVSGDSDSLVPFEENGRLLKEAYEKAACPIEVHIKPGADHHPHGLSDPMPLVRFIEKYV